MLFCKAVQVIPTPRNDLLLGPCTCCRSYAWKPAIIKDALVDHDSVLWMDAGDFVATESGFNVVETLLEEHGFVSAVSQSTIARWTHEGTFQYFGIEKTV